MNAMKYSVDKKFQIYNSLFLNLGYKGASAIGFLIPLLGKVAKSKLMEGQNPIEVFENFFGDHTDILGEDKFDFMFKVIQYVERQIVLFDSIEDSISPYDLEDQNIVYIDTLFTQCKNDEERANLIQRLNDFSVRIVLTAHPTQFYRPPVLDIISKLRTQIKTNNIEKIDSLLHQLGLTTLVNSDAPTPLDEAKNIIHICRYQYYDAIGKFFHELKGRVAEFSSDKSVMLGFWPCGDRDGNPYVTYETTRDVINELRMNLMKCYYKDLKSLSGHLTFKTVEPILKGIQDEVYQGMFDPQKIVDHTKVLSSLKEVKTLLTDQYEGLYTEDVEELITKVDVFKNHFASLDIRQDHSVHDKVVFEILKHNGYVKESADELDENTRIKLLTEDMLEIPADLPLEGVHADTIKNIAQLPQIQKMNGERGCHRYVISNSEDIYSVLNVLGLMRWISKSEVSNFDIIPLFETMIGMQNSEAVMRKLYSLKVYKDHLARRKEQQTIMLGFSDGTKDGGYLKANWSIYKTKENLSRVSKEYGYNAIFFDGRGGPPARGGGKTHNFYAARSSDIANNDIQLTIQGQTITSTYGTAEKFVFNAEQMITSGLVSLHPKASTDISAKERALIEELSEISYKKYLDLKAHPDFLPYLANMTTLKFYSKTKIGSRPGKRNKSSKLSLSDLRAIAYVGSWSQLKQNIPGYYGVGTAIKALSDQGKLDELKALYKEVPLFKTLIDNSMMSLTKCFFELTSYIENHPEFGDFWKMLYEEYNLSKDMILKVTQMDTLMANELSSKKSIKMRDEIVLPLLLIQHYALQKLNSGKDVKDKEVYEKLVVRSLYGNINASRNSA